GCTAVTGASAGMKIWKETVLPAGGDVAGTVQTRPSGAWSFRCTSRDASPVAALEVLCVDCQTAPSEPSQTCPACSKSYCTAPVGGASGPATRSRAKRRLSSRTGGAPWGVLTAIPNRTLLLGV